MNNRELLEYVLSKGIEIKSSHHNEIDCGFEFDFFLEESYVLVWLCENGESGVLLESQGEATKAWDFGEYRLDLCKEKIDEIIKEHEQ